MANDYCTAAEIKAMMPDGNWGSGYDTLLATLATRASRALDLYLGRSPGAFAVSADETRYFDGSGTTELWVGELAAAPTSVSVAEGGELSNYTDWDSSDYFLWPYNAPAMGEPYLRMDVDTLNGSKSVWSRYPMAVKVVGKFGYSTSVPEVVKMATIIQAARWFKRGQQAFEDTGAVAELGQLRYVKMLDPDVENLVNHLRRVGL